MKKLILASTSPQRKQLLQQVGITFVVVSSNYVEKLNPRLKPRGQAEYLSKEKAQVVAKKYHDQDVVIIGANSVVDFKEESLGKPKSEADAKKTLLRLSGGVHSVITAFTIISTSSQKTVTKSIGTKVYFRKLSLKEIDAYVKTKEPMESAGSYSIEKRGALLVDRIEGDYFNVVGLPLSALTEELKRFGITVF